MCTGVEAQPHRDQKAGYGTADVEPMFSGEPGHIQSPFRVMPWPGQRLGHVVQADDCGSNLTSSSQTAATCWWKGGNVQRQRSNESHRPCDCRQSCESSVISWAAWSDVSDLRPVSKTDHQTKKGAG